MTIDELQKKRAAFKAKVLEYLKDSTLSYRQVGDLVGVSAWRVCQIRKESGMPNRVGGRRGREDRQGNRMTPGDSRN
jgi:hypothetical protein